MIRKLKFENFKMDAANRIFRKFHPKIDSERGSHTQLKLNGSKPSL